MSRWKMIPVTSAGWRRVPPLALAEDQASYLARRAAVLLLILLGHLALMASPLHAAGPHPGDAAPLQAGEQFQASPTSDAADDCAPRGAPPPDGVSSRFPLDSALLGNGRLPLGAGWAPLALAHGPGPPRSTDAQALLQVFRI